MNILFLVNATWSDILQEQISSILTSVVACIKEYSIPLGSSKSISWAGQSRGYWESFKKTM